MIFARFSFMGCSDFGAAVIGWTRSEAQLVRDDIDVFLDLPCFFTCDTAHCSMLRCTMTQARSSSHLRDSSMSSSSSSALPTSLSSSPPTLSFSAHLALLPSACSVSSTSARSESSMAAHSAPSASARSASLSLAWSLSPPSSSEA